VNDAYKKQVRLLLGVLPEVAKEDRLALHGGTAINLFVRVNLWDTHLYFILTLLSRGGVNRTKRVSLDLRRTSKAMLAPGHDVHVYRD